MRPSWFIAIALTFGSFFVALIGIYSIYCLIRLLVRVAKRDIFSRRNVYWIRWFAYVNAGIYLGLMLFTISVPSLSSSYWQRSMP